MNQESELATEIKNRIERERNYGWYNYYAAYGVALLALIGSIAASLCVAFEVNKILTAVVAAIPAIVLSITRIFNFERRAFFHWKKYWKFQGLLRQLRDEQKTDSEVSHKFSVIDEKMLNEWVAFDYQESKPGGGD